MAQRVARLITLEKNTTYGHTRMNTARTLNELKTKTNVTSLRWPTATVEGEGALHSLQAAADSYLRQRVLRGCPHFKPVARYSKSSVNSWFSPNSTTSLKCFTCWTTVYSWKTQQQWGMSRLYAQVFFKTIFIYYFDSS